MKKSDTNDTFESKLARLEEIVGLLDGSEIPLNEMLKNYEEGNNLVKELRDYLNNAEMKIVEINKKTTV